MAKRQRKQDWKRCRVEASVLSVVHGYSRALGPGALVDLAEPVADNLTLADFVLSEWFEDPGPVHDVTEVESLETPAVEKKEEESEDGTTDRS